jgi:YbgC/YbaW family acyl-CoA thioester hydrolase
VHWIVRRTIAEFSRPVGPGAVCTVRTWVADFRRVRSRRCYEVRVGDAVVMSAESDWVLVDMATGRPRRIPEEVEGAFDAPSGTASPARPPWDDTPLPVTSRRVPAAVRFTDLDSLGHVNNAAYLDVLSEAALAPLGALGWDVARLGAAGLAPSVAAVDIEYLAATVWGEPLEVTTWMAPAARGFDVVQHLGRAGERDAAVRARTRWEWHVAAGGGAVEPPAALARALATLAAA